jgi:ribosomal protein S18 acetylase RimI-like enzyme
MPVLQHMGRERIPMVNLRPMTSAEFDAWMPHAVAGYAADKVASGQWIEDGSVERSRTEHAELLPAGLQSAGQHLFKILNAAGEPVGDLWFAAGVQYGLPIAYVYNVAIDSAHRRLGYAGQALTALEEIARSKAWAGVALHVFGHNAAARSLYAKLGYIPTNLNLFKPVVDLSACHLDRSARLA